MPQQRKMEFTDPDSGNVVSFDWNRDTDPTEEELEQILSAAVTPQRDNRSFLGELFGGFGEEALPAQSVEEGVGLGQMLSRILPVLSGTPTGMATGAFPAAQLGGAMLDAQKQTFAQGSQEVADADRLSETIGGRARQAAGLLPLIGPAAANVGSAFGDPGITDAVEQAAFEGEGNLGAVQAGLGTPEGGRALGRAAGQVLPGVVSATGVVRAPLRGARNLRRTAKGLDPIEAPTAAAIKPREVRGVELTGAQRTGGLGRRLLENLTEGSLFGSRRFKDFLERQKGQLNDAIDESITSVYGGAGARVGGREVGELAQEAAEKSQQALRKQARDMFETVDAQANPNVMSFNLDGLPRVGQVEVADLVDISSVQKQAREMMGRLENQARTLDPGNEVRSFLQDIIDSPRKINFRGAQDVRSDLLAISRARGVMEQIPGKRAGAATDIGSLMDDAMEQAAQNLGGDVLQTWRDANSTWKRLKTDFNNTLLAKVANTSPEGVANLLKNANVDSVRLLKRNVDPQTWQKIKGSFAERLIEDAKTPTILEGPQAIPGMGSAVATGEQALNPRAFANNFSKLRKDGKLKEIFSPEEIADFAELAEIAKTIGKTRSPNGIMAGAMNAFVLARGLQGVGGNAAAGLQAGAVATLQNIMGRMLTSPAGRSVLKGIWRTANTPNTRNSVLLGNQMAQFMTGEEEKQLQGIVDRQEAAANKPGLGMSLIGGFGPTGGQEPQQQQQQQPQQPQQPLR